MNSLAVASASLHVLIDRSSYAELWRTFLVDMKLLAVGGCLDGVRPSHLWRSVLATLSRCLPAQPLSLHSFRELELCLEGARWAARKAGSSGTTALYRFQMPDNRKPENAWSRSHLVGGTVVTDGRPHLQLSVRGGLEHLSLGGHVEESVHWDTVVLACWLSGPRSFRVHARVCSDQQAVAPGEVQCHHNGSARRASCVLRVRCFHSSALFAELSKVGWLLALAVDPV